MRRGVLERDACTQVKVTGDLFVYERDLIMVIPLRTSVAKYVKPDIADSDKAAISGFAASAAAGRSMPMVPQYTQLLDVLGIIQSGVMSKAMSIDEALKDGQSRAEAVMAG
jgi:maltose-binding protein MalE